MQSQIAQKDSIIATLEAEAKKQKISDPDVTAVLAKMQESIAEG